jgi:hypothetical protein
MTGPGRTRRKLAKMLSEYFHATVHPEDIWENRSPAYRLMDLARWGVDINGRNVHSFSTMGFIVKSGIAICSEDGCNVELS